MSPAACTGAVAAAAGRATGDGELTATAGDPTAGDVAVAVASATDGIEPCGRGVCGGVAATSPPGEAALAAAGAAGWAWVAGTGAGAGAAGTGTGFGLGLMIVAAPRLHAEVAGRFDCAHAAASSSDGGAPPLPAGPPPPSEALPPPTDAGATGSCALLDQPLCAIGACDEAAPLPPAPPLQPEEPLAAAGVGAGPGDEVGALPPTAAAQPPPPDTAGIGGDASAVVSPASPAALGPSPVHAPPAIGGFAAAVPQLPLACADALAA